jgi:hypothetical protein
MLVFMQQQLLNFFAAVRKEGEQREWNFQIITKNAEIWTEKSMLIQKGLPEGRIWLIEAHVTCSFQMKCATGFFAAHRTVNPRTAAWNIERESKALVADVRAEFAGRYRECQQ